jgi:hypothetical protein
VTRESLDFVWEVPVSGFRWIEEKPIDLAVLFRRTRKRLGQESGSNIASESNWLLEPNPPPIEGSSLQPYDALSVEPPLFRTFANLEPSREGILEFANRYGPLGAATGRRPSGISSDGIQTSLQLQQIPEDQHFWQSNIIEMKELLDLWNLYESCDIHGLSELIRWDDSETLVQYQRRPKSKSLTLNAQSNATDPVVVAQKATYDQSEPQNELERTFERFTPGDVLLPALIHLQRTINTKLENVESFGGEFPPRLVWSRNGALSLTRTPPSLFAMLWLQFAGTVTATARYTACLTCGRWVRIGSDAARSSRHYCSNACRTRGLRERQRGARSLHAEGKTLQEIAEKLKSDVRTVAKWVGHEEADS